MKHHRAIMGTLAALLNAAGLFFLGLYFAMPENKYEWMRGFSPEPITLPIDPDTKIRGVIYFSLVAAPSLVAILLSQTIRVSRLRYASTVFGCVLFGSALLKLLA